MTYCNLRKSAITLGALASITLATSSQAGFVSPTSVVIDPSDTITETFANASYVIENLIDNDTTTSWVTTDPAGFPSDYITQVTTPVLQFDMGASLTFNTIALASYTGAGGSTPNGNSVTAGTIRASEDPNDFSGSDALDFTLSNSVDVFNTLQSILLDGSLTGRYIQLTVTDNDFGGPAGGDRVGFSEFRVNDGVLVLGDVTGDGLVLIDDYEMLRDNFGTGTLREEGDVDFDGDVDLHDYHIIETEFPKYNNGVALQTLIPEPASLALLSLGGIAALCRRK